MKTSLEHLPKEKQDLINYIVKAIIEKIEPEKIILFGSHATDQWVEDEYMEEGREYDYKSDYDFLVITKSGERRPDYEVQEIVEHRSGLNKNVSAITHDIDYINGKLSDGQYFFSEIQMQGILLYDAGNIPLVKRRKLSSDEKRRMAREDFDTWFESAVDFMDGVLLYLEKKKFKKALFLLHQAAEHTYNTVILVFRGYKPKTHNLEKLRRYAKHFSKELTLVFPMNTNEEKRLFDLLKRGYVEARYDKRFVIEAADIIELVNRVKNLQVITAEICRKKIESF